MALEFFYERGFEGTTIDAITSACNMAKRTVYARYDDKATLFQAALQRGIEQGIVSIDRLREAETDDLEESLIRIGRILTDNISSPAGQRLMRIANAEAGRLPELGASALTQATEEMLAYIADLLTRRLKPAGAPSDVDCAARAFLYLVAGGPASLRVWGAAPEDAQIDRHVGYCVGVFLRGLRG